MKPQLITTRDLIRSVAEHWKQQYFHGKAGWGNTFNRDSEAVYNALAALDPEAATGADVGSIIGNETWVSITCNACDQYVEAAVVVGQPEDYESHTATLCQPCLAEALALFAADPRLIPPPPETK